MPVLQYERLESLTAEVVEALGSPPEEAALVAKALARANLAGHDSHGVIRLEQYAAMVREGAIVPGAPLSIIKETPAIALVDGGWNFGQVIAYRVVDLVIEKARNLGIGAVALRNSNHVGRLGEYTLQVAKQGLIAIATLNNHGRGNLVAPFGGTDGRLATNPISIASPGPEQPLLMDITSSVTAEGKVRVKRNAGQTLPEGWIIDNQGRPSTNPNDLYTDPRGAILPMGGCVAHKGYALGMMIDVLSGALSGAGCSQSATGRLGNAMFLCAIDLQQLVPREEFDEHVRILIQHVTASPPAPGFERILLSGEPELRAEAERAREGIPIDAVTWGQFAELAQSLGVEVQ